MKCFAWFSVLVFGWLPLAAQPVTEGVHTVQFYQRGNQNSFPIMSLGGLQELELHFDDFSTRPRNFSYTFQLCNADWTPAQLNVFDFIKGFTQTPLRQYRNSSIARTSYIHYQATLPEAGSVPSRSGNYLLKVFLNGDTSQLVFSRRFLVVDNQVGITAQIVQPYDPALFRSHQKLQISVDRSRLNLVNPQQQLRLVVLQNFRWDNAVVNPQPSFIRNQSIEYNGEQDAVFPGGQEYRWADLRSFRFRSERIQSVDTRTEPVQVTLLPDPDFVRTRYQYLADRNGFYEISSTDLVNPLWQGDYAWVKFRFAPAGKHPLQGQHVYLAGQFNDYRRDSTTRMRFNEEEGVYELPVFLKQGYYSYTYTVVPQKGELQRLSPVPYSYTETENEYTVLVYYRSLSGRHDELLGLTTVNSRNFRNNGL